MHLKSKARLNINLRGTNFVLDASVKWVGYGEKANVRVHYSQVKLI